MEIGLLGRGGVVWGQHEEGVPLTSTLRMSGIPTGQ